MRLDNITRIIGAILLLLLLIMRWSDINEGLQLMKKGAQTLIGDSAKDYLDEGHIYAGKQEKFGQHQKPLRPHLRCYTID